MRRNNNNTGGSGNTLGLFIRLTRMVKPHRGLLSAAVFFSTAGNLSSIALTGAAAYAAAVVIAEGRLPLAAVITAVVCGLMRGALRYGEHYFGHDIAFRLLFDIRKKIFAAVNRLAPAKLLDRRSGDICSTVMSDVEYVETFFAHTLAPVMVGFIVPAVMLAVFAIIKPAFALIMLPYYLLMGLVVPLLSFKSAAAEGNEYRNSLSRLNSMLVENLQGLRELMLFKREGERLQSLLDEAESSYGSYRKIRANEGMLAAAVEVILLSAVITVLGFGGWFVAGGSLELGALVLSAILAMTSFGPLISLMFLSNSLVNTSAAAGRIFSLLDEEPVVSDHAAGRDSGESGAKAPAVDNPPEAEDVAFAYPGTEKKILEGLNLSVRPGRVSALKAESGRGKSTILYLMMRFFDPSGGRMVLDGADLRRFNLDGLRECISYFTQETTLFNISVMDNIRLADDSASDEQVYRAAEKAGIHRLISGLPEGYDTLAGEQGSRFSSGERQRIGLARIFLQDNSVILLDEPVSNLDSLNEKLVMENLKNGLDGKSVVLVSHRDSVVAMADEVIEL